MELIAVATYVDVDTRYTEPVVMAHVSQAERWVNEFCGRTFTAGSAPDGVVFATLEMARYMMNRQMLEDEYLEEIPTSLSDVLKICSSPLNKNKVNVDYSTSADDFYLPSMEG